MIWTVLIYFRIGTSFEHMWMSQWNFGFRKIQEEAALAGELLPSQDGLCCSASERCSTVAQIRFDTWET
jgi:hypothetical protein